MNCYAECVASLKYGNVDKSECIRECEMQHSKLPRSVHGGEASDTSMNRSINIFALFFSNQKQTKPEWGFFPFVREFLFRQHCCYQYNTIFQCSVYAVKLEDSN